MVLQFAVRKAGSDITVVDLGGRMTLGNRLAEVEHAIKTCIAEGAHRIVLDLADLEFMDSAGIGMVMLSSGIIKEAGGQLHIAGAQGNVKKVMEMTHVHEVIPMLPDLNTAITAFDAAGGGTTAD